MNLLSLSEVMKTGCPWRLTISLTNNSARGNVCILSPVFMGIKWADLIRRSTMTHMTLFPFLVLGSFEIKSMVICSHFHSGISNGCNNPRGFWCSAFTNRHVIHRETKAAISLFMLSHQNLPFKFLNMCSVEARVKHGYLAKHIFIWNKCKTWISGKTSIPHIANPVHRRTLQIALLQGSHNRGE